MGNNGTLASLLVERLMEIADRRKAERERLVKRFAADLANWDRETTQRMVDEASKFIHSIGTLQAIEAALIRFAEHGNGKRFVKEVEAIPFTSADEEEYLTEDGVSDTLLQKLRNVILRKRRF